MYARFRSVLNHPCSTKAPLKALMRSMAWYTRARITGRPTAFNFADNLELLAVPGLYGVTGNIQFGLHEFAPMSFIAHCLRSGDLFLDGGANIGSYTILAAGVAGADVLSFEPAPESLQWLRKNIRLNRLGDRARVHAVALSSSDGHARISTGRGPANHLLKEDEPDGTLVRTVRLQTNHLDRDCCVAKLDLEGFEYEVVDGCDEFFSSDRLRALVVETNGFTRRFGKTSADLINLVESYGFTRVHYDPRSRGLAPASGTWGDMSIFVRDVPEIRHRVSSAATFRVLGQVI